MLSVSLAPGISGAVLRVAGGGTTTDVVDVVNTGWLPASAEQTADGQPPNHSSAAWHPHTLRQLLNRRLIPRDQLGQRAERAETVLLDNQRRLLLEALRNNVDALAAWGACCAANQAKSEGCMVADWGGG